MNRTPAPLIPALALLTLQPVLAADPATLAKPDHPWEAWELTLESGYLWKVGAATAYDYEIAPTQFTLRTPQHWLWWEDEAGARLLVRARFSLVLESIIEGPEDYFFGINAAPSIEYWFPSEQTSLFFSVGGGAGLTNSTGLRGGQAQDFTLNWFSQLGVRQAITTDTSLLAAAYFLHHSNGGQTEPNPGLDTFGFTVGVAWVF